MQLSFYHIALLLGILSAVLHLMQGFRPKEYKRINFLVIFILVIELLSVVIWGITRSSIYENILLFNLLYVYIRPTVLLVLFSNLPYSCKLQRTVLPATMAFLFIGMVISIFLQPIAETLQSYTYLIGHAMVLFYSIIFFKDILKQSKFRDINLLSLPYFWMASLILFSYGERYFFFIFTYYFPSVGSYGVGNIFLWVQFLAGVMYLSLGLSFYAPRVFSRYYT